MRASAPYARAVTARRLGGRDVLEHRPPAHDGARRRSARAAVVDLQPPTAASRARSTRNDAARGRRARRPCSPSRARRSSIYVVGRSGGRLLPVPQAHARAREWTGDTDTPSFATAPRRSATTPGSTACSRRRQGGVDEIHIVYNRFVSRCSRRRPRSVRLLPPRGRRGREEADVGRRSSRSTSSSRTPETGARRAAAGLHPEPHLQRAAAVGRPPSTPPPRRR